MTSVEPLQLAIDYLLAARAGGQPPAQVERRLASLGYDELAAALTTDSARTAFWTDLYNGAVLHHPVDISHPLRRWRRFRASLLTVAGRRLSLDTIEHGILRRSRPKLGLGYVSHPLPSRFERAQRVTKVDPRIHFALNCGAASCPPIAAYRHEVIDEQLELATRSYLTAEVHEAEGTLRVPAFMLWYIGDFGGRSGVRRFLERYGIETADMRLRPAPYDWSAAPSHWAGD